MTSIIFVKVYFVAKNFKSSLIMTDDQFPSAFESFVDGAEF